MNTWMVGFFILLLNLIFPPQEESISTEINNKLASYSWNHPTEKIYLHTDKSYYVAGEDIWFKTYLMIGPYHIPDSISTVVYVELIHSDGTLFGRKIIRVREGLGWGDFDLPSTIPPGKYIMKAYTRYMQNFDQAFFFRKRIQILPILRGDRFPEKYDPTSLATLDDTLDKPPLHIQFFPEGGELVSGLQSYVAFKATGPKGTAVDVKGIVKNSKGQIITDFESQKFGMGYFVLKPEENETYQAILSVDNREDQFEIPAALDKGYVMHVNKSGDNIYIWVRNNMKASMDQSFVIGQFRGFPFITIHARNGQDFLYSVLSSQEIPSGIIHFTFFDSLGIPRCERLVYTENEKERIDFRIGSDKQTYKRREKATFDIHSEDLTGNPTLTNLSLSIVSDSILKHDANSSHIKSYFILESDLKGNIENPGYFFNPEHADRFELLDILMLTQGWRRFVWKEILADPVPSLNFEPEFGFNIAGDLVDFYNQDKKQPGNVRLFIYENQLYYNEIETDDQGNFQFKGLNIFDSTHVVMQAWRMLEDKGKQKKNKQSRTRNDLAIRVRDRTFAEERPDLWPTDSPEKETYSDYLTLNDYILKIDSSYEGRTIILDELLIKDEKIASDDPFDRPGKLYDEPSNRIIMDSLPVADQSLLLFDLIRKYVPGINYSGAPPDIQIIIRGPTSISGSNQALLLLDGMEVESDFMYYFPPAEIAFIDVLKSSRAAMYGGRAGNSVIAFYTKMKSGDYTEEERKGITNFVYSGYYRAREFYTPDYDVPEERHIKPDFRRTLYWNPSLTTDDLGNIEFSFFTSDETGNYRVDIEGMTYDGIPFIQTYHFSVE